MININLKEYNQALDRAIDECADQIPKANNQNLFTLLDRISQLRKEQAEIGQRINEQLATNSIEPPVQHCEKSLEINDASSDSAGDSFSTQIHSQESSASSNKSSEVNILQRSSLTGQFNKAMEILEKEERVIEVAPRIKMKKDYAKVENNDKNVQKTQFQKIEEDHPQIACIVIDDEDEVEYIEQLAQPLLNNGEQSNLNSTTNNRNNYLSPKQCTQCILYNSSQLEQQLEDRECICVEHITEQPNILCEQSVYPEIIDLETFTFDHKNSNYSPRNSSFSDSSKCSISPNKSHPAYLSKAEAILPEQKYIHPLHYIQDESIEDLQDNNYPSSQNKSNIKFTVSEESLLDQGFRFFQDSLLNYKTALEWNHPEHLDLSQLFKRKQEIYNHQIVTAKALELMRSLVGNRAQGLKQLRSKYQQYFTSDQFDYLVQYATVVLEYLSARGVEDDIKLQERVKFNGKVINIDVLAMSETEAIIIDWKFSNEIRSNLILDDSLNSCYLDKIAGIEGVERRKKVSLMILPLKNMPIQLVEYTYGEIESIQNQRCNEYKYQNEMLLRAKREQKIIPKQVKQRVMECWNGQELTIGEIFKNIQIAFNKKNEGSNIYFKHFSRVSNHKFYSQNEREGDSNQQLDQPQKTRMLVNFYHVFLFCKELQKKNGYSLRQL